MDDRFFELTGLVACPLGRRRALRLLVIGAAGIGAVILGARGVGAITCYGVCDSNNVCQGGSCPQGHTCSCVGRRPGDSYACSY